MIWKILRETLRLAKNATIIIPFLEGIYYQVKETLKYQSVKKKADEIFLKHEEKKDE